MKSGTGKRGAGKKAEVSDADREAWRRAAKRRGWEWAPAAVLLACFWDVRPQGLDVEAWADAALSLAERGDIYIERTGRGFRTCMSEQVAAMYRATGGIQ